MKIGINQFCWPACTDVEDAMRQSKALGFDSFELCFTGKAPPSAPGGVADALDIAGYENRLANENSSAEDFIRLKKISKEIELPITGVGGIVSFSLYPLTSKNPAVAEKAMAALHKMAELAQVVGADTVLLIPGMLTEELGYEEGYRLAQKRIAHLAEEEPDILWAVENVWNHMLYSPLELARFVDEMERENVGLYFDVANARRFGHPQQWIRTLGSRIKKIHAKDYRMANDNIHSFCNLLEGDVDWPAVIAALQDIGYTGELVLELIPPAKYQLAQSLAHGLQVLRSLAQ